MCSVQNVASIVNALGTLLTGLGTAAIAYGAVVKAPRELNRWRTEKRDVRRSEVAGEAIAATDRLVDMLFYVVAGPVTPLYTEPPHAMRDSRLRLLEELKARWETIKPDLESFEHAAALAIAYLPGRPNDLLKRLREARALILRNQEMCTIAEGEDWHTAFGLGFGSAPSEKLQQLRTEIVDELRPIAQLMAR